jgi:putative RecB family exonuclease
VPKSPYSHSKLSTFETCPRQFDYRYVQRIARDTESVEAFVGKRVHEILERLYHHLGRHGRPPSLKQVLDRYRQDWGFHWHENVEIVRQERDAESYRLHGQRCLEGYYRKHYPFEDGETVALEHQIAIRLDEEGEYRARGIIDRLARRQPGHYEIHDYKTSATRPPRDRLARDRQLSLYQLGVLQAFPEAERVDLVWHYLAFGQTLSMTRSPEELERVRTETIKSIDTVEAATDYPPRPGPLCRWCEYRDLCPDAQLGVSPPPEAEPASSDGTVGGGIGAQSRGSGMVTETAQGEPADAAKQLLLL